MMLTAVMSAQTVTGRVTDKDGVPLIGVNITEKGTARGTITDLDGKFDIQILSTDPVLIFS